MKPTLHLDFFRWQGRIQGVSFHYLHYFHHSLASGQKNRGRTQPCPKTENWIKDLQNMAPPSRTRPSFPLSQSLSSGSFHKPLILLHQKEDRLKTTITENQTNRSNGPQPCQWNSMKLWSMPCRATQDRWAWWRVLTKHGPLEKGMANHFNTLALRIPWRTWKSKKTGHWKMNSPGW